MGEPVSLGTDKWAHSWPEISSCDCRKQAVTLIGKMLLQGRFRPPNRQGDRGIQFIAGSIQTFFEAVFRASIASSFAFTSGHSESRMLK
jgi:hypothetical protein